MRALLSIALLLTSAASHGQRPARDGDPAPDSGGDDPGEGWINVRAGGGSLGASSGPVICMELSPWGPLSVESCGTGAGLFREQQGDDVAHFRGKWRLYDRKVGGGVLRAQGMLGFAELEVGEDDPGFRFTGSGERGVETAGPEAGVAIQYLASIGKGVEAVASLTAGMAYFPYADDLVTPRDIWQPFVGLEVGAGF